MAGRIEVTNDGTLFVVRFIGAYTDADFDGYIDAMDAIAEEGSNKLGMLVTESNARLPSHRHVRRQAEWLQENRDRIMTRRTAFVLPSPIMRGALRVVFRLQPSPTEYKVFREEDEALRWLRSLEDVRSRPR
ncbi:MAG: STAS/SEC14 domain-containing protein [Nannocystaceae bacterium]|nr:STAS/SEC14 domain-containing protein [bacterium]